ncbi:MAG: DNA-protecting protein DprA [Candidatus Zixiibacteriota bacterium]|nr:MAG: DNA-protecting protein DprA [candidate division Zixibacteria bacterium]
MVPAADQSDLSPIQAALFTPRRAPGEALRAEPAQALTLISAAGVGSARYRALLNAFGSPGEALKASERALCQVPGIEAVTAAAIHAAARQGTGEKLLEALSRCGARIVSIWDSEYPRLLKEIHDPPALLFVRGELPCAGEFCFAIVGTRHPGLYGMKQAHVFATDLAAAGVAVVSGMARGVDTSAHDGALQARGRTFAVFGCGVDIIYPAENRSLAERIAASGGLISEFLPGVEPDPGLFPRRNRIISGLCRGVLVVQGSETSGALITARYALDQNRDIFALPGNVDDRRSRGPHRLLREGAILAESAQDVLRELGRGGSAGEEEGGREAPKLPALTPSEESLLARIESEPVHIDQLVRDLSRPVASVLADLLGLEMKGWITQSPGKLFTRKQY